MNETNFTQLTDAEIVKCFRDMLQDYATRLGAGASLFCAFAQKNETATYYYEMCYSPLWIIQTTTARLISALEELNRRESERSAKG